ncbi:hypothetical protein B0H17DRAFT_1145124 [Mycena rosella]|uniref:Uncharacterized protein n=1 Tax=Mycena rosella TaxID=1033263 RepID=A0AAD7G6A3_MYCRO|nr:hypothetical protein B0H17DRAFT_1145124 [Mycena rosella]
MTTFPPSTPSTPSTPSPSASTSLKTATLSTCAVCGNKSPPQLLPSPFLRLSQYSPAGVCTLILRSHPPPAPAQTPAAAPCTAHRTVDHHQRLPSRKLAGSLEDANVRRVARAENLGGGDGVARGGGDSRCSARDVREGRGERDGEEARAAVGGGEARWAGRGVPQDMRPDILDQARQHDGIVLEEPRCGDLEEPAVDARIEIEPGDVALNYSWGKSRSTMWTISYCDGLFGGKFATVGTLRPIVDRKRNFVFEVQAVGILFWNGMRNSAGHFMDISIFTLLIAAESLLEMTFRYLKDGGIGTFKDSTVAGTGSRFVSWFTPGRARKR